MKNLLKKIFKLLYFSISKTSIYNCLFAIFYDTPLISDKGNKILSDKEDREILFKALREGKEKILTKQGVVYIY